MVDIHSHVLYGVDDGARTLEESLAMVRMAAEHGTTDLVATPHANPVFEFDPQTIAARLKELQESAGSALTLHSGCDFHLTYDNIQDALVYPSKYTINGKRYLMVEFSDLLIFHNTAEIFDRLIAAGMTPVITHPERNPLLRERIDSLAQWIDRGVCIQVTAQSLLGDFGRRAAEFSRTLLDRRMVHFVASDGHNLERRPPRMDLGFAWIEKNYSLALAETLCIVNPHATLTGEFLAPLEKPEPPEPRKWYQFWG